MTNEQIREKLFELQDLEYRDFHINLMPGVDKDSVIGIRTPGLKKFAKELFKASEYEDFISLLPHDYYDEMNLHSFIISEIKDYDTVVKELDRFLPYVNNWATCDGIKPKKAFAKNKDRLQNDIKRWMNAKDTYTVRFGIEMLLNFFLDEDFNVEHLDMVSKVKSEEYYINMMIAWYFATALAKQYDATIPYIENKVLSDWTHNKTIQKARESFRVTKEQKEYLNSLKVGKKK